jgi:hypothetical protein
MLGSKGQRTWMMIDGDVCGLMVIMIIESSRLMVIMMIESSRLMVIMVIESSRLMVIIIIESGCFDVEVD